RAGRVDRYAGSFRSQASGGFHDRALQARGMEGARRVHVSLQHQVGDFLDELEVVGRDRERSAKSERRQDRGLALKAPTAVARSAFVSCDRGQIAARLTAEAIGWNIRR